MIIAPRPDVRCYSPRYGAQVYPGYPGYPAAQAVTRLGARSVTIRLHRPTRPSPGYASTAYGYAPDQGQPVSAQPGRTRRRSTHSLRRMRATAPTSHRHRLRTLPWFQPRIRQPAPTRRPGRRPGARFRQGRPRVSVGLTALLVATGPVTGFAACRGGLRPAARPRTATRRAAGPRQELSDPVYAVGSSPRRWISSRERSATSSASLFGDSSCRRCSGGPWVALIAACIVVVLVIVAAFAHLGRPPRHRAAPGERSATTSLRTDDEALTRHPSSVRDAASARAVSRRVGRRDRPAVPRLSRADCVERGAVDTPARRHRPRLRPVAPRRAFPGRGGCAWSRPPRRASTMSATSVVPGHADLYRLASPRSTDAAVTRGPPRAAHGRRGRPHERRSTDDCRSGAEAPVHVFAATSHHRLWIVIGGCADRSSAVDRRGDAGRLRAVGAQRDVLDPESAGPTGTRALVADPPRPRRRRHGSCVTAPPSREAAAAKGMTTLVLTDAPSLSDERPHRGHVDSRRRRRSDRPALAHPAICCSPVIVDVGRGSRRQRRGRPRAHLADDRARGPCRTRNADLRAAVRRCRWRAIRPSGGYGLLSAFNARRESGSPRWTARALFTNEHLDPRTATRPSPST